jgi:hypothetical protein
MSPRERGANLRDDDGHASELAPVGAVMIDLGGRPHYLHSGWFLISDANLVVIVAMVVVFALAIVVPFPRGRNRR